MLFDSSARCEGGLIMPLSAADYIYIHTNIHTYVRIYLYMCEGIGELAPDSLKCYFLTHSHQLLNKCERRTMQEYHSLFLLLEYHIEWLSGRKNGMSKNICEKNCNYTLRTREDWYNNIYMYIYMYVVESALIGNRRHWCWLGGAKPYAHT